MPYEISIKGSDKTFQITDAEHDSIYEAMARKESFVVIRGNYIDFAMIATIIGDNDPTPISNISQILDVPIEKYVGAEEKEEVRKHRIQLIIEGIRKGILSVGGNPETNETYQHILRKYQ